MQSTNDNGTTISKVLATFEYGIYVVTMGHGPNRNALTTSWLAQVSSDPPMVMIAIKNSHRSAKHLSENGCFVINLLKSDQSEIARLCAEPGNRKIEDLDLRTAPVTGCPVIDGASGFLDCKVVKRVPAGDHTVLLGEIQAADLADESPILTVSDSKMRYGG